MPRVAVVNYIGLFTSYLVGYAGRQARLRSWTDLWLIAVATFLMMFAYHARESDMDWCMDEDHFIQGHAVWHSR